MDHWDDWVTDGTVTLQQMNDFMHDKDNIGRKWQGKYMVATTSGSTGNPLVMLCDKTVNNVMAAVSASRSYARKKDMSAFIRKGGKSMGVYADSGFYLGNSTIRSKLLMMPWKKTPIWTFQRSVAHREDRGAAQPFPACHAGRISLQSGV